ncbi:hypothetical protein M408DRAFT_6128 [Serendipita vermifera MAFF 305830]|uniref:Phytase-like domain-containing protein n=1 Tax=Serendipita vermifera MAFF 305830 TaxID=933852 RepID=A0A0C3BKR2_SERVB|nr:hypothetical protein M408DRAFT_6128 [Serendipita vermifera MAFF 305830]
MKVYSLIPLVFLLVGRTVADQDNERRASPDPSLSTSVTINGQTFVNKGLVAFGYIPADAKDQYGETFGGIGSAITFKRGTFNSNRDGTFSGKLIVQPDRGYNVEAPIDWQTRQHVVKFTLKPYYGVANLPFSEAAKTLKLDYVSTTLYTFNGKPTSGDDPEFVDTVSGIKYPVVASNYTRLTTDTEGLVSNKDGTFWMSDEYGPYVYLLSSNGKVIQTIVPPEAVLPRINGTLNFTSASDPQSGRCANQGMEALTASPSGDKLYGLLQSALAQEGSCKKKTNKYARFFKWNVENRNRVKLEAEYVVPLPQSSKPETYAQSEIYWLNKNQFLVLARDGNGQGGSDPKSAYKAADIFDISSATNIANTDYDLPTGSIAPGGQLLANITPATYVPFVQYVNDTQLARFGLHNGAPADQGLINAKWESLALAPVGDREYPNDYFLFTFADNDFQTHNGVSMGQPYNATVSADNQALVYRVTLPSVKRGSVEEAIGI